MTKKELEHLLKLVVLTFPKQEINPAKARIYNRVLTALYGGKD